MSKFESFFLAALINFSFYLGGLKVFFASFTFRAFRLSFSNQFFSPFLRLELFLGRLNWSSDITLIGKKYNPFFNFFLGYF